MRQPSVGPHQVVAQGIELSGPEVAIGREPLIELDERGGVEAIEPAGAIDADADEAGAVQGLQMLGDIGLGQRERLDQGAGGLFALTQLGDYVAADGIGNGGEGRHAVICRLMHIPVKAYDWSAATCRACLPGRGALLA